MNFNQVWTKLKFFLVYMRRIPAAIAAVLSYINKSKNDPKLDIHNSIVLWSDKIDTIFSSKLHLLTSHNLIPNSWIMCKRIVTYNKDFGLVCQLLVLQIEIVQFTFTYSGPKCWVLYAYEVYLCILVSNSLTDIFFFLQKVWKVSHTFSKINIGECFNVQLIVIKWKPIKWKQSLKWKLFWFTKRLTT